MIIAKSLLKGLPMFFKLDGFYSKMFNKKIVNDFSNTLINKYMILLLTSIIPDNPAKTNFRIMTEIR